ncbi:MAG TPA: toll/interleukin-1 receptor domain-containing protein [Thermoanaerobaculia bacterium]|nr:toll/interleukin-1 receptor domain-containing protein [Thermoanaerobaculia bacterium]
MATRVFISHSARDGRAAAVREAIRAELGKDEQYEILMDDVSLDPGDAWRARINLWLGSCDVAIVIVSPGALTSSYVAYELSILGYRRLRNPEFRVIPVFVDVTMQQVEASMLKPTVANEWFGIVEGEPADIATKIVAKLDGVVPIGSRPIERMARVLDTHLPNEDAHLTNAAAALEVRLPWDTEYPRRFCLALQILGSGMTDPCAMSLRRLREQPQFQTNLAKVIELVSSAWVDLRADELPALMKKPEPLALALNATNLKTVRMYLVSAKHRVPADAPTMTFHLANEPNIVIEERDDDDEYFEELVTAIRNVLYPKLNVTTDEAMKAALKKLAAVLHEPVVVAVRAAAVSPSIIAKLRDAFKHVTFFVLAEKTQIANADSTVIHVIRPLLGDEDESQCHARFDEFYDLVVNLPLGD